MNRSCSITKILNRKELAWNYAHIFTKVTNMLISYPRSLFNNFQEYDLFSINHWFYQILVQITEITIRFRHFMKVQVCIRLVIFVAKTQDIRDVNF
jgi:hypothetical protein